MARFPIENNTAVVGLVTLGIITILAGLTRAGFELGGFEVPMKLTGLILLSVAIIIYSEIGFKKLTKYSRLKQLGTQQYIILIINTFILITAISFLFEWTIPTFISMWGSGALIIQGVIVIWESFY